MKISVWKQTQVRTVSFRLASNAPTLASPISVRTMAYAAKTLPSVLLPKYALPVISSAQTTAVCQVKIKLAFVTRSLRV